MVIQHCVQIDGVEVFETFITDGQVGPTQLIHAGHPAFLRNVDKYCQENGYRLKSDENGSREYQLKTFVK